MKKLITLSTILNQDDSTFVSVSYVDADNVLQTQELSNAEITALLTAIGKVLPDYTIVK